MKREDAGLKPFERHLALGKILKPHRVKIAGADIYRQVLGPIILDPVKSDKLARFELANPVTGGAERRHQRRLVKGVGRVPGLREDRHAGHDKMQVAAAFLVQHYFQHIIAFGDGHVHVLKILLVVWMALVLQNIQREGGIARRQLRSVMKPRFGTQQKAVGELVRRHPHGAGHKAIHGVRLICVASHQAVKNHADARRALAFQDVDIQRVKGLKILVAADGIDLQRNGSAFGCVWVDIGKTPEIRAKRQLAER